MPTLSINQATFELSRKSALLDTNVLVGYHDETDTQHHENSVLALEGEDYDWLVLPAVVVEACGILNRRRGPAAVLRMLSWLFTPGVSVSLFPNPSHPPEVTQDLGHARSWMSKYNVEYVDACVMKAADYLTQQCDFRPHIPIFTFDTGHYQKCVLKGYKFSIYDMRTNELLLFD